MLNSVKALHDAGVDILVGTDTAPLPLPFMAGVAHGASVAKETTTRPACGVGRPQPRRRRG